MDKLPLSSSNSRKSSMSIICNVWIQYDAFHAHCYLVLGIDLWILFRVQFQMYTLVTYTFMTRENIDPSRILKKDDGPYVCQCDGH